MADQHQTVGKSNGVVKTLKFEKPEDENRISILSKKLLDMLRVEAGVRTLHVTSTIRTAEEQAAAMYKNEVDRQRHKDRADALEPKAFKEATENIPQLFGIINSMNRGDLSAQQADKYTSATNTARSYMHERNLEAKSTVPYRHEIGRKAQLMATHDVQKPKSNQNQKKTIAEMADYMRKGGLIYVTNHAGVKGLDVVDVSYAAMTPKQREKFKAAVGSRFGSVIYRFGYPGAPRGQYTFPDTVFHLEVMQPRINNPRHERIARTS